MDLFLKCLRPNPRICKAEKGCEAKQHDVSLKHEKKAAQDEAVPQALEDIAKENQSILSTSTICASIEQRSSLQQVP